MVVEGGDIKDLELNLVLKNFGKWIMEGKIVKDYNEYILSYFFKYFFEIWN